MDDDELDNSSTRRGPGIHAAAKMLKFSLLVTQMLPWLLCPIWNASQFDAPRHDAADTTPFLLNSQDWLPDITPTSTSSAAGLLKQQRDMRDLRGPGIHAAAKMLKFSLLVTQDSGGQDLAGATYHGDSRAMMESVTPTLDNGSQYYTTNVAPQPTELLLFVAFHGYLAAGVLLTWHKAADYCHGVKFLAVVTLIVYLYFICDILVNAINRRHGMWVLAWCCVLCFLVVDAYNNLGRLISIAGALALILLGFIFSNSRSAINWYQIMWGIMLQFVLGVLVLRWAHGRDALQCIADKVKTFLSFTFDGSTFVFGYLAKGFVLTNPSPSEALSPFLNSTVPNITEFVGPTIKNLPPVFLFL
ncbi:hypothetical protein HPB47_004413, partial [Ixodes persulcatus]